MEELKYLKSDQRKQIVVILARGLIRCVDNIDKSRNISKLEKNNTSQIVAYIVDIPKDKSVSTNHEN